MNNELYPELPQAAQEQAQKLIDGFKDQMKKAGDEALQDLYCDIMTHIESDSWSNFRASIINGLSNYNQLNSEQDKAAIRKAVLREHREEIINDLNQDNLKEIDKLKQQLEDSYKRY